MCVFPRGGSNNKQNRKTPGGKQRTTKYIIQFTNRMTNKMTGIRKMRPCNVYPLIPHFYIEKQGFAGVYLIFLFLVQNIYGFMWSISSPLVSILRNYKILVLADILMHNTRKTCPCNEYPLKPHFYIEKNWGLQGYTYFS